VEGILQASKIAPRRRQRKIPLEETLFKVLSVLVIVARVPVGPTAQHLASSPQRYGVVGANAMLLQDVADVEEVLLPSLTWRFCWY
jgi:hypothetical protein